MRRTHGNWSSTRRYIYTETNKITNLRSNINVDFEKEDEDFFYVKLSWDTSDIETGKQVSDGEILTRGTDDKLYRNIGYMTDDGTVCNIDVIDEDCVVLNTSYNKMRFREEIRLVENDNIRLRQTLGFKDGEDNPFLVGQYFEERVSY